MQDTVYGEGVDETLEPKRKAPAASAEYSEAEVIVSTPSGLRAELARGCC